MDHDTIAWLVPSYGNNLALRATQMRQNAAFLSKSAPAAEPPSFSTSAASLAGSPAHPGPCLRLAFSQRPKNGEGFLIGTDESCDIVLPKAPGISRRHCALTFDEESRLVLRDTSKNGTAVWYDHSSNGDRRGYSWVLSSGAAYGFPDQVRRIVVDVQTVRFQVVVNRPLLDGGAYARRVDDFLVELADRSDSEGEAGPGRSFRASQRRRVDGGEGFVKYTVRGAEEGVAARTFLWNTARPWDPIIPFSE